MENTVDTKNPFRAKVETLHVEFDIIARGPRRWDLDTGRHYNDIARQLNVNFVQGLAEVIDDVTSYSYMPLEHGDVDEEATSVPIVKGKDGTKSLAEEVQHLLDHNDRSGVWVYFLFQDVESIARRLFRSISLPATKMQNIPDD